jgi:hypothetical protein
MTLRIENPFIEADTLRVIKDQKQVCERLRQPKRFFVVQEPASPSLQDIVDGRVSECGFGSRGDVLENVPSSVLICHIARCSICIKQRLGKL